MRGLRLYKGGTFKCVRQIEMHWSKPEKCAGSTLCLDLGPCKGCSRVLQPSWILQTTYQLYQQRSGGSVLRQVCLGTRACFIVISCACACACACQVMLVRMHNQFMHADSQVPVQPDAVIMDPANKAFECRGLHPTVHKCRVQPCKQRITCERNTTARQQPGSLYVQVALTKIPGVRPVYQAQDLGQRYHNRNASVHNVDGVSPLVDVRPQAGAVTWIAACQSHCNALRHRGACKQLAQGACACSFIITQPEESDVQVCV